jgi:hypothetical protein
MYDTLAELFVYAFAIAYAVVFLIIAQRWIHANLGARRKMRRTLPKRPPSDSIQL